MFSKDSTRAFGMLWIGCSIATLYILWHNEFLPMVDLPAFAGTVGMLSQLKSGSSPFESLYLVDLWQPYIVATLLTYYISLLTGVPVAIKIVLSITALGLPLSLWFIARNDRTLPRSSRVWISVAGESVSDYFLPKRDGA